MATTECRKCKMPLAAGTKFCSNCGKKVLDRSNDKWIVLALVAGAIYLISQSGDYTPSNPEQQASSAPEPTTQPAAPPSRQDQIEDQFSPWDGAHREFAREIRSRLNNPSSFDHVETRYVDNGETLLVQMTFRGENAFGGTVTQRATGRVSMPDGEVIEVIAIE